MARACGRDGRSSNRRNPSLPKYNAAGKRDPGRSHKRWEDQFLIQLECNSDISVSEYYTCEAGTCRKMT
jgi:hypothetical protein